MTAPVIAQKAPYEVELKPGTYWWCACGRSKAQPFCDGSHEGTGIEPVEMVIKESRKAWLCGCKQTAGKPYCDGSHKRIE